MIVLQMSINSLVADFKQKTMKRSVFLILSCVACVADVKKPQ